MNFEKDMILINTIHIIISMKVTFQFLEVALDR